MCPASSFNWTRISGDAAADAAWNASHTGMKQVALLPADMASDVQITCTYSETEGTYGTMQVDEALMASHTPATADASDVFALVDGDLVVTTASENGTDYVLEDDTLSVNSGFTGTISATAAFSSGEQDADAENIFGLHFENAAHAESQTLLRIVATNENTALEAHVVRGGREITDEYPASSFNWTRASGDAAADAAWNASHAGMKQIALTPADTVSGVEIRCTYSETEGSYGTVQVDGAMTAYHTPATADANDTFALVDGVLTVTTDSENGSDYAVDGNTLIVNSGFTGTITSTVTVTDGARTREIDFIYDHNGLRTGKVVTEGEKTETTEYTLHGKLIMHMAKRIVDESDNETVQELHFFYDAQSKPAFVEYNGTKYRYLHNLQGDIVGIVDSTGAIVVEYKYDAWGKTISITGSMADTLGKQNPFRYRGYVYDEETELYYLLSRYNNPKTLRFINHDAFVSLAFQCGNGFMYCNNSPIILLDENGCDGYSIYINFYAPDVSNANFGHYDFSIVPNNGTMKYTYNGNEYSCEGMTFSFGPITSAGDENMSRDEIIETKFPARVNVYLCAQRTDVWDRILICDNISEDSINNYLSWFQKDCAEFINGDDPMVKVWYMKKNSGNGSYENYWIKKLLYCGTGMFWLLSHITGLFDPKVNKNSKALTDMKTTLHNSALAVTQDVINKFKESFAPKH